MSLQTTDAIPPVIFHYTLTQKLSNKRKLAAFSTTQTIFTIQFCQTLWFFFFSHHFLHPTNLCREHFSFLLFSKVVCAISRVHKPYLHSTTVFLCWLLFFGKLINLKAYGQVLRQHNLVGMWFFPLHILPQHRQSVGYEKKREWNLLIRMSI